MLCMMICCFVVQYCLVYVQFGGGGGGGTIDFIR
jgi:hypothetical protein